MIPQGGGRIPASVKFGRGCIVKWGATLTANTVVGDRVFLGPYSVCLGDPSGETRPTVIGDDCFIGGGAMIAAGVHICDGVTIGALSFVARDITEPGTYVGQANGLVACCE